MNKSIIPELLQDNFNVRNLLLESERLINNKEKVTQQLKDIELFLTKSNLKYGLTPASFLFTSVLFTIQYKIKYQY